MSTAIFSQPSGDGGTGDEPDSSTLISMAAQLAHTLGEKDKLREQLPESIRESFDLAYDVQSVKLQAEGIEGRQRFDKLVAGELEKRQVRRLADAEEAKSRDTPIRRSLFEELELPDEEEVFSIDKLLPLGGNALFAGKYKAGKTTFNGNLLKSWADDVPFLGRYTCSPDPERPVVTIFNYEMGEGQFRRWLRQYNIRNTQNVHVVHLRGISLPLGIPTVREEVTEWLIEANTGLWIVDPASRAMAGLGDGNDNRDVNEFTAHLDEIKRTAGVRDLVLNVHMSHAANQDKDAERALGAQAWSAWADALWTLTIEKTTGSRWFHAYGRDVDEEKSLVDYDDRDRSIKLIDTDPDRVKADTVGDAVLRVVEQNPGCNKRTLLDQAAGLVTARRTDIDNAAKKLIFEQKIHIRDGKNRQTFHYLPTDLPALPTD